MAEEQDKPVKKPVPYEPVQEVEVSVECGDSSQESIDYEPKQDATVFIKKSADNSKTNK